MSAIQKLASQALVEARPKLRVFLHYAKTELTPPKPNELPEAVGGLVRFVRHAKIHKLKHLTVREAWLNTLVGLEIGCWFFLGEVIGRGN